MRPTVTRLCWPGRGAADPTAEPWYEVSPGAPLTISARHLGPCQDTYASVSGCGAPRTAPTPTPVVLEDVTLRVVQGSRSWVLGTVERSTQTDHMGFRVTLPPATLQLQATGMEGRGSARLVIS